jgi:hypothetical protein
MAVVDDWFAEPKPKESLNDLYDRRLVAWGYLDRSGRCAWEPPAPGFTSILQAIYAPVVRRTLNESLFGFDVLKVGWKANPEGPA